MKVMKRPKPPKIEFYPNDEDDKTILSIVAGDVAEIDGTTKSVAVFEPFRRAYLPRTKSGNATVKMMIARGGGVKAGLGQLCATLAGGSYWVPRYDNGLPVLEYIDEVCLEHCIGVDFSVAASRDLMSCFDSLVAVVEAESKKDGAYDEETLGNLRSEAVYGRRLYKEFEFSQGKGEQGVEPAGNLTRFIRSNWTVLANKQVVWRCLYALCSCSVNWPDQIAHNGEVMHVINTTASQLRIDTIHLIDQMTWEWERIDADKADA